MAENAFASKHLLASIFSKMRVYDGENLKDTDPKAKSHQEYRDTAGVDEGMEGLSTRFAFKILTRVFNFDHQEVAAACRQPYIVDRAIGNRRCGNGANSLC